MVLITYWQMLPFIAHADTIAVTVLILVQFLVFIHTLCMQAAKALVSLQITAGLHENHSFIDTVTSTKVKCADSFDLFFVLLVIF